MLHYIPLCTTLRLPITSQWTMGLLPLLAIVNSAVRDIGVPAFFQMSVSIFLGYTPRGELDHMMVLF